MFLFVEHHQRVESSKRGTQEPYNEVPPCDKCDHAFAKWKVYKGEGLHVRHILLLSDDITGFQLDPRIEPAFRRVCKVVYSLQNTPSPTKRSMLTQLPLEGPPSTRASFSEEELSIKGRARPLLYTSLAFFGNVN